MDIYWPNIGIRIKSLCLSVGYSQSKEWAVMDFVYLYLKITVMLKFF